MRAARRRGRGARLPVTQDLLELLPGPHREAVLAVGEANRAARAVREERDLRGRFGRGAGAWAEAPRGGAARREAAPAP